MHFVKSIIIKFIAATKRSVWNYFPSVLALRYCGYVHTVVAYQSKLKKVEGLALPASTRRFSNTFICASIKLRNIIHVPTIRDGHT